jgi:DNA replication protein DnaC
LGKPVACKCKAAELALKRREQLYDLSGLCAYREKSFTRFNPRVPGVQEAYRASREYARRPDGWLVLVGGNGCGKTHLAAAIANDCLDQSWAVYCSSVPDMLDHLRSAFAPTAPVAYDRLFSIVRAADLLVLDDLGAEQSSSGPVKNCSK